MSSFRTYYIITELLHNNHICSFRDEYGSMPLHFIVDNANEQIAVKKADYLLSRKPFDLRFVASLRILSLANSYSLKDSAMLRGTQ